MYLCLIYFQEPVTKNQTCPEILQNSVRIAVLGQSKD